MGGGRWASAFLLIGSYAFNQNRAVLAGFSKCESALDLACVRDGFHLGMAKALNLESYKPVQDHIIKDIRVAAAAG